MTNVVAPSLDQLLVSENPAWLWDGERTRIVWANSAGTSWFGAETLFDLLDVVFDNAEKSVAAIEGLTETLPRGEKTNVSLKFANAVTNNPISCDCYVHALADGRSGLLVCARTKDASEITLSSTVQAMALGVFPLPVAVVSGAGRILFTNQTMKNIWPDHDGFGFANDLIAHSFKAGLASGFKSADTKHGIRDIKVLVRPLEKEARLVDTSFLLVLEDVTERRALERSLVQNNQGNSAFNISEDEDNEETGEDKIGENKASENKVGKTVELAETADVPAQAKPQIDNEVARALDALRQEIESRNPAPEAEKNSEPAPEKVVITDSVVTANNDDVVPEIVSSALNRLPQPLVLLDENGRLLFANDVTVELMGVGSWQELDDITTLGDALAALEGEDGAISLFTAKDEPLNLDVIISSFPWKDGPAFRATLSPGSDGEQADNRRAVGVKKNSKEATLQENQDQGFEKEESKKPKEKEVSARPLLATSDNVVSLHVEKPVCSPSDDELRAILDTATDGIITLDSGGKICSFSAGAQALFGYNLNEVLGKKFTKLLDGESRKIVSEYLDALSGAGLAAIFNDGREVDVKVKQGGIVTLFLTIGLLDVSNRKSVPAPDGTAAFCVVVRDITQWKKTEADLRQSKEKAEKSNAQKSMFLANISHELRTPLNAIMGFSEVMRSERFGEIENEKYLAYANDIHASGGHLLALINDLLDLSKVESGKLELNFTSVNLLNVVDEAMHLLGETATEKRVLMRKSSSKNLPHVVADLRSMKQIMLNLLSNSVKFSNAGDQVTISATLEGNGELHLSIKDTGPGMNKKELRRALEPFQRGDRTGGGVEGGTGLGLPLTKALVEANRAKFTITSQRKKGTLAKIVFPTTRVLAG